MKRSGACRAAGVVALLALSAGGCATPIGVKSQGRDYAYDQIDRSALTSDSYSSYTGVVLHRYNLDRLHARAPLACVTELHRRACADSRRDALFALAELCYLLGKEGRSLTSDGRTLGPENLFAASSVYAYLFLLGPGEEPPPGPFDRRFRIACDLYNRGLSCVIARREGQPPVDQREWLLPVGSIVVRRGGGSDLLLPLREGETFVSADRFQIRGLTVRNRNAGLGAPVVIAGKAGPGTGNLVEGSPATVFLHVEGSLADEASGTLRGEFDVYSTLTRDRIDARGQSIPLEADLTTPIAYALNDPDYWRLEKRLFWVGQAPMEPGIYPAQPYQAGRVPVLFVHGTMGNPVRWAEMWNTLVADRVLRERCQFWFYLYDSGKPVVQSAAHLRDCVQSTVARMDPEGKDPMLREMVVIGHSQGGLLTKLTATHTGEALVLAATGKAIAELKLSPDEEQLVRRLGVFEPLQEVKRVVFISTPHRGSYRAGNYARKLARRLLRLPLAALTSTAQAMALASRESPGAKLAATSIDSMSPDNKGINALASIPVTPPIEAHSIISIKGDDQPPHGDDGVVKYTSAHIEGVESELVVRSGHACLNDPATIEEVRRILLEHLARVSE